MNPLILYDLFPTFLPLLFGHEVKGDFFFTSQRGMLDCTSHLSIYTDR